MGATAMRPWFWLFRFFLVAAAPGALAQYGPPPIYGPSHGEEPIGPKTFDVTLFAGYQVNGDASTSGGNLNIGDAPAYGAALDWRFHRLGTMELMWEYTKPTAKFDSSSLVSPSSNPFTVPSHYFQIGGLHAEPVGRRAEVFLGLTVGAALFLPETISLTGGGTQSAGDTWRFAFSTMLGTKIWATPNLGVRLEVRLLVPVIFTNDSFYSSSAGSGLAATAGIPSLQFAFTGGLVFGQ